MRILSHYTGPKFFSGNIMQQGNEKQKTNARLHVVGAFYKRRKEGTEGKHGRN